MKHRYTGVQCFRQALNVHSDVGKNIRALTSNACLQAQVEFVLGDIVHVGVEQEAAALVLQGPAEGPVPLKRAHKVCAALLRTAGNEFYPRLLL